MAEAGPSRALGTSVHCPYHPEGQLIEDHSAGDMICPECGLVVGDRVIDVGSEWRTFSNDKSSTDRSRVGGTEDSFLESGNLTTYIGTITSKPGSETTGTSFKNWQKGGGMSAADRSLTTASGDIKNMVAKLNLTRSIEDRCKTLFKQVYNEKRLKGRANDAIAAACLFIACRQEDVPRSFKEICSVSKHPKKEIGRCFKIIQQVIKTTVTPVSTTDFMSRYCTNLQLPMPVQKAASHIAEKAVSLDLAPGRVYLSVAAAAIYMASQASAQKKTQKEVGDVVGVADSTIRQSYRLLYPARDKLFPEGFAFTTPLDQLPKH
ncbi:transcription initiation factor IIB-like [Halichondria panicea]|uniref:transcription initiation factor IIB-like n=1 Tax=Halichondria panicea TaxID=6063 RepID=UPI00312B332F